MSISVILVAIASARPCPSVDDIACRGYEFRATITSNPPPRVAVLVSIDILQKGQPMVLLPGTVNKVFCVCH